MTTTLQLNARQECHPTFPFNKTMRSLSFRALLYIAFWYSKDSLYPPSASWNDDQPTAPFKRTMENIMQLRLHSTIQLKYHIKIKIIPLDVPNSHLTIIHYIKCSALRNLFQFQTHRQTDMDWTGQDR